MGEVLVATPGVWMRDFLRVNAPLISGLDLSNSRSDDAENSFGRSRASRNAANSSGDAFLFTSCNNLIAASISDCVVETRDTFESCKLWRLVVELRLLRKNAERDLDCARELDRETTADWRPRPSATVSVSKTSLSDQTADPASLLVGDSIESLFCCRPFALRSVYRGESG
jgi:hypothetical protein